MARSATPSSLPFFQAVQELCLENLALSSFPLRNASISQDFVLERLDQLCVGELGYVRTLHHIVLLIRL
jgi:hypothetical protein